MKNTRDNAVSGTTAAEQLAAEGVNGTTKTHQMKTRSVRQKTRKALESEAQSLRSGVVKRRASKPKPSKVIRLPLPEKFLRTLETINLSIPAKKAGRGKPNKCMSHFSSQLPSKLCWSDLSLQL